MSFILLVLLFGSFLIVNVHGYDDWYNVSSPTNNQLNSIDFLNDNYAWAVGNDGAIIHWNGTNWRNYSPSPAPNRNYYSVDMINSNDGWAVGSGGRIIRWNGTDWNTMISPIPETDGLYSIEMSSPSVGWAVGSGGRIIRWNGVMWSIVPSPTGADFFDLDMISPVDGWAVGSDGTIIRWNGASWSTISSPTVNDLKALQMISSSEGWAVGNSGTIIHWNGTSWSTVSSSTVNDLESLVMVSYLDGWAVGSDGTIILMDDGIWGTYASPTGNDLKSMYMVTPIEGWAVGSSGTIIRMKELRTPIASFSFSPSIINAYEIVNFDGSDSRDTDGPIISYEWDFGDGNTGTGITTSHSYALDGMYTVTLTVIDEDELIDTTQRTITVNPSVLIPPNSSFIYSPSSPEVGEIVSFDASSSSDPDGIIVEYEWDFDDGGIDTGIITSHSYASVGVYTVTLTVTDSDNLKHTTQRTITINPIDTISPISSFTYSPPSPEVGEIVSFDASSSSDPDGIIDGYDWDFGDGSGGSGVMVSHSYALDGIYTVTLTVIDEDELIDTTQRTITINPVDSIPQDQTYVPGVEPGNWFDYTVTSVFNDSPNLQVPNEFESASEAERMRLTVTSVEEGKIGYCISLHFENGTTLDFPEVSCDVVTGEIDRGDEESMVLLFVASNLDPEDRVRPDVESYFTGSYMQSFEDEERQINYISQNFSFGLSIKNEMHFEKVTGAPTYIYQSIYNDTANYLIGEVTISLFDSDTLGIPESAPGNDFPTSLLIILIVASLVLIILIVISFRKRNSNNDNFKGKSFPSTMVTCVLTFF